MMEVWEGDDMVRGDGRGVLAGDGLVRWVIKGLGSVALC